MRRNWILALVALCGSLGWSGPGRTATPECLFRSNADFEVPWLNRQEIEAEIASLRQRVRNDSSNEQARQRMADIAVELGQWIERLEASGLDVQAQAAADLITSKLPDTMWRIGFMARNGNDAALTTQATLHRFGAVLEKDEKKACEYYRQAADLGDRFAIYRSAICVAKEEPRESLVLMSQAGELGHPSAAVALGLVCLDSSPRDDACALAWFCQAARKGRPRAAGMAGWMLDEGRSGVQDPASALVLYQFAAERGDRLAQNNLGKMYEIGNQVPMDINQAARWYLEAAEAGFGPAQVNIGRLYAEGNGVPFDLERSIYWLRQAEGQGIQQATEILNWMRENLLPSEEVSAGD